MTNSVITAFIAEIMARVPFSEIEGILMEIALVPSTEGFEFEEKMTLDIAGGVTSSLMLMEQRRAAEQQEAAPKIVDALGEQV